MAEQNPAAGSKEVSPQQTPVRKSSKDELEERLAKKKLEEFDKEEKKLSTWEKLINLSSSAATTVVNPSSDMLPILLIFIGGIGHYLKYYGGFDTVGYAIDASLAVYVGVIIFIRSKQTNPAKRILSSIPLPLILFFLSRGILYVIIARVPFLTALPGLDFTFNQKYWPWWMIYGIWVGHKSFNEVLKVAHALFVFWLMIWPILGPAIQPILAQSQESKEQVEAQGQSYPIAYAACVQELMAGKLNNIDLETCVQRKMHPLSEEEIRAQTAGRIKSALKQAVTASIAIDPLQIFFLPQGESTTKADIQGRISATSIKNPIIINMECGINNKPGSINLKTFSVRQSALGQSEQFICSSSETLKVGTYPVAVLGTIKDMDINSILVGFFIDGTTLQNTQEQFITSKDSERLKIIEQWSSQKSNTAPYSVEKATNYLNKEIYKPYIKATYPDLKVQSESDPGYVKLNLMIERIYPDAQESSAIIGLSDDIDFEIGISNNLKDGKILKINSGKFDQFPSFLDVVDSEKQYADCPINADLSLDPLKLNKQPLEKIEYQKEKAFLCKLKYKEGSLSNIEEVQTAVFSLNMTYDYRIEKKGNFEIKRLTIT